MIAECERELRTKFDAREEIEQPEVPVRWNACRVHGVGVGHPCPWCAACPCNVDDWCRCGGPEEESDNRCTCGDSNSPGLGDQGFSYDYYG